jgi:hypothetical protein
MHIKLEHQKSIRLWYISVVNVETSVYSENLIYIVACGAVAMQRPGNGRISQGRFCATAR